MYNLLLKARIYKTTITEYMYALYSVISNILFCSYGYNTRYDIFYFVFASLPIKYYNCQYTVTLLLLRQSLKAVPTVLYPLFRWPI